MLTIVSADESQNENWDNLCQLSPDAWLWHTSLWRRYSRVMKPERFVKDLSFLVFSHSKPVAGCLLTLERTEDGQVCFSFSREPIPAPFFSPELSLDQKRNITDLIMEVVLEKAKENNAVSIEVFRTALLSPVFSNPWLRYGFHDSSISTSILDLTLSEPEILARCSKGHRSCIKQAKKILSAKFWDTSNINREVFSKYQELHRLDAGRVTRPQETFDIMLKEVKDEKNGVLIEAVYENKTVGFILVLTYKNAAFYASSCRHPDHYDLPIHHFLIWEALSFLNKQGVESFEIGFQFFGHELFRNPSTKLAQLAVFKRGFGCEIKTVSCAERFFSKEYAKKEWDKRISSWLEQPNLFF